MQSCFWQGQRRGREAVRRSAMLAGRRGEDGETQPQALWEEGADRPSTLALGAPQIYSPQKQQERPFSNQPHYGSLGLETHQ